MLYDSEGATQMFLLFALVALAAAIANAAMYRVFKTNYVRKSEKQD